MGRTIEEINHWKSVWYQAKANMPKRSAKNTGWAMLGLLLFGKRGLHMRVYNLTYNGRPPKDDKQRALLILFAGPYGKVFARVTMIRRGLDPTKYIWS